MQERKLVPVGPEGCDGEGPHKRGERRVYSMGLAGNAILCRMCWYRENIFRVTRQLETGNLEGWPEETWREAPIYKENA